MFTIFACEVAAILGNDKFRPKDEVLAAVLARQTPDALLAFRAANVGDSNEAPAADTPVDEATKTSGEHACTRNIAPGLMLSGKVCVDESGAVVLTRKRRGKRWNRLFEGDELRLRAMAYIANAQVGVFVEEGNDEPVYTMRVTCDDFSSTCAALADAVTEYVATHKPPAAPSRKRGRWVWQEDDE